MGVYFDDKLGQLVASVDDKRGIQQWLRDAAENLGSRESDEMLRDFGAVSFTPIRLYADYEEGFAGVFQPIDGDWKSDRKYPIEEYDVIARQSSLDAGPITPRIGSSWGEMDVVHFDTGFSVGDLLLKVITYGIVESRMRQASLGLAKKRDDYRKLTLGTAASSVTGHVFAVSGGAFTKQSVDQVFDAADHLGYTIQTVITNKTDINKMRGWPTDPFGPGAVTEELFRRGFVGNYGGATWKVTRAATPFQSGSTNGEMYFLASPDEIGYELKLEGPTQNTERDARARATSWWWDEYLGCAVVNPFAIWKLLITG